jgi:hypothetical protein
MTSIEQKPGQVDKVMIIMEIVFQGSPGHRISRVLPAWLVGMIVGPVGASTTGGGTRPRMAAGAFAA